MITYQLLPTGEDGLSCEDTWLSNHRKIFTYFMKKLVLQCKSFNKSLKNRQISSPKLSKWFHSQMGFQESNETGPKKSSFGNSPKFWNLLCFLLHPMFLRNVFLNLSWPVQAPDNPPNHPDQTESGVGHSSPETIFHNFHQTVLPDFSSVRIKLSKTNFRLFIC